MAADPTSILGLVTDLERRLQAVADDQLTIAECSAWARGLADELVWALRREAQVNPISDVAANAVGVLCDHSAQDPALAQDAVVWLTYLRGPRPPFVPARHLATLDESPAAFASRIGADVVRGVCDGIGLCRVLLFQSRPPGYWFSSMWGDAEPHHAAVGLAVRPGDDPTRAAQALFERLAVDEHDVCLSPDVVLVEIPEWTLLRTDDNANCVAVMTTRSRAKAEARRAALEATGHRQSYEVVAGRVAGK